MRAILGVLLLLSLVTSDALGACRGSCRHQRSAPRAASPVVARSTVVRPGVWFNLRGSNKWRD